MTSELLQWTILYSICSAAMLLGNRAILKRLPYPQALTFLQLAFASVFSFPIVLYTGYTKLSSKSIGLYICEGSLFCVSILLSLRALTLTNVGTVIIARCLLPVLVFLTERAIGTKISLSSRSCGSMLGVLLCGTVYAYDSNGVRVSVEGLYWTGAWLTVLALQIVFGKWLLNTINVKQMERVLYTNISGIPLLLPFCRQEVGILIEGLLFSKVNSVLVLLTCLVGVSIGYTSWQLRAKVAPTTFSLIGLLNKMTAVFFAFVMWSEEGTPVSLCALLGCLLFGALYQGVTRK